MMRFIFDKRFIAPMALALSLMGVSMTTPAHATPASEAQEHLDLAMKSNELILIHTPHLEDKYKGTRMILDMLRGDRRVKPHRVLIDHVEEHTIKLALDAGFWVGMTLYPVTKCTPERAVDMVERTCPLPGNLHLALTMVFQNY